MRTVSACLLFLVAASIAAAQTCTAPSADAFSTSGVTGCSLLSTCQSNLCACTGSSGSFPTCLSSNTGSCTSTTTCYANYITCLMGITSVRSNSSACGTYGNTLYLSQLAAAAASSVNGTALSQSCIYNVCLLQNQTGSVSSCSGVTSAVCTSAVLLTGGTTTIAVSTLSPVGNTTDIVVTVRISGDWATILANPTTKASAMAALLTDLSKLLGVASRFINIISVTSGSLILQFGVYSGSGVAVSTLASTVSAAQGSSSWLASTSSAYTSAGGTGSLTTLQVTALTAAPGQTLAPGATAPPASSAIGAAGVWAAAAFAAIVALMA